VYNAVLNVKTKLQNADYRNTLETIPYRSGEINDFRTARLGLIDKADVKNPIGLLIKIFHARDIAPHGIDTHDYGILTEPMKANMVFTVEPEFYIPEGSGFV
jgi:Xaa-Pro aminopeptidase